MYGLKLKKDDDPESHRGRLAGKGASRVDLQKGIHLLVLRLVEELGQLLSPGSIW